ncbi:purple acid phosphatase family protein [Coprothermobacter platensis]|uniref:purple acid phosphatase family protein n=1 Tax=Coprothermobacter platensis TaxID=108819 RepID=UPI00037E8275|nr:metallophosphoesterase family protein [Coprothermobacter platensis]
MRNKIGRGNLLITLMSFLFISVLEWWAFSQHGTWGLYNWNYDYRYLLNIIIGLGFLMPAIVLVLWLLRNRLNSKWFRAGKVFLMVVSIAVFVASLAVTFFVVVPAYSLVDSTEPVLTVEPHSGSFGIPNAYIYFRTKTATVVSVQWGSNTGIHTFSDSAPTKEHFVRLSDLRPGTQYFYQVGNTDRKTFTTPLLSSTNTGTLVTFAVGSDFHYGGADEDSKERTQGLKTISNDSNINMFFMNGDIVDLGMTNKYWTRFFNDVNANMTTPIVPVLGNHDTLIGGLYHFEHYFYPKQVSIEDGNPLYHRIDVGNVHFLVLEVLWGTEEFTPSQKQWLESELKSIPQQDWVIVISHCFYYSSGDVETGREWSDHVDTTKQISPLFEKYHVDLVISGHNHHMELLSKDGVTYALDGVMGGGLPAPRTIISRYSKWLYADSRGFLEVVVKPNQAELIFKKDDGQVIQHFVISQNQQ